MARNPFLDETRSVDERKRDISISIGENFTQNAIQLIGSFQSLRTSATALMLMRLSKACIKRLKAVTIGKAC